MKRRGIQSLRVGVMLIGLGALLQDSSEVCAQLYSPQRTVTGVAAIGRYQIVINQNARADTFLLDTATGRVWERNQYTYLVGKPAVWQVMDRVDSAEELLNWEKWFDKITPEPSDSGNKELKAP